MKSIESRLSKIESRFNPQPERIVILCAISNPGARSDEGTQYHDEYFINSDKCSRPEGIKHEDYLEDLKNKCPLDIPIVVVCTVLPSSEGRRVT